MAHERPPYLDEPRWPTEGLPPPEPIARPVRGRRTTRKLIIGGIAGACALGLGLGLLARPSFRDNPDRASDRTTAASDGQIQIVKRPSAAPAQPAPVQAVAADDAQPADTVSAAPMVQAAAPAPRPEPAPTPVSRAAPVAEAAPPPRQIVTSAPVRVRPRPEPAIRRAAEEEDAVAPQPVARQQVERPGFNCRYARSQSERLVCADGRLASYDRRLNRAFNRAVRNGVSYRELRREQDRWLRARENAARVDPDAVENVYRSRIAELEEMGDGG
ncbi:MAG TPA: lysozyme inhibitor LprI family protein [Caulobacteraceae bacterium]|jgi:uncharacterized protein YecT (DUF1311 family)